MRIRGAINMEGPPDDTYFIALEGPMFIKDEFSRVKAIEKPQLQWQIGRVRLDHGN
ncbi:hypothetical protein TWF730_002587 [Orbilia blumenaviensis]|uniref:Uncharacterized protein n=1 Tax=Orbilia blumenaviensis TaxID=1796055 RepID=A0AAV9UCK4_9PEZI